MPSELLKKHSAVAADEIERRGWATGDVAKTSEFNHELDTWDPIPVADCKVCVLGGLGASYFGDPRLGMNEPTGTQYSPEYEVMIAELADIVYSDWVNRTDDLDEGEPLSPITAAYTWNDELVEDGAEVIAKLREIAAS